MADLGIDISCTDDLDPAFTPVTGTKALAQAMARRLITPRGSLFYDLEYGFDLRAYLNAGITQGDGFAFRLGAQIEAECLKDERVGTVDAQLSYDPVTEKLTVLLSGVASDGPFRLVLAVSAVTVEILRS
jgi:hypothetical protein